MRFRSCAWLLLVPLSAVGCSVLRPSGPPPGMSSVTTPQAQEPLRVCVLPLWRGDDIAKSSRVADDALTAALRELGRHQVTSLSTMLRDELIPVDPVSRNQIASAELLRVRERTACDAVLMGRVDQYRPYDPVLIAMTVHLVSCHDGSVLWSASAVFDGQRHDVQADIARWWLGASGAASTPINDWRQVLQSPSQFSRYAAWRLVSTIVPPPPRPPAPLAASTSVE